jgi:peptide/nickel transport system substrate-binding protein
MLEFRCRWQTVNSVQLTLETTDRPRTGLPFTIVFSHLMRPAGRLILAVLAIVFAAGCGAGRAPAHATDTLVIAQAWEPHTLNPLLHIDYNAYELDNLVYSMLLQQDAGGRLVPDLATNVPSLSNGQISADGRRIVYHLRRGLQWQDGQLLTASDVVFTYRAIMNPHTSVPSRDGYDGIDHVEAPDAYTIVVHLKHRFSSFLSFFFAPGQGYPVLPAHLLSRYASLDAVRFNSMPIGSGPYRVVRWSRGDRLELEANSRYFAGSPHIQHLIVRYVPNGATILNQLQTGEADVYFMADPSETHVATGSSTLTIYSHPIAGVQYVFFNTQNEVLRDSRVRRALALSLDVPYIANVVSQSRFSARYAQRGQFYWAFDPSVPDLTRDVAAADRLLDDAGWRRGPDGIRLREGKPLILELSYQSGRPVDATIGALIQQQVKVRGIAVMLKGYRIEQYVAPASLAGPLYSGKFQLALLYGGFPDPDVSHVYGCASVAPNGYNFARYCNPALDAELRAATSTFDLGARFKAYSVVQRILARDVPSIIMWQDQEIDIVPSRLRGFAPSIISPFFRADRWELASP